jgi:hypothetical protein
LTLYGKNFKKFFQTIIFARPDYHGVLESKPEEAYLEFFHFFMPFCDKSPDGLLAIT